MLEEGCDSGAACWLQHSPSVHAWHLRTVLNFKPDLEAEHIMIYAGVGIQQSKVSQGVCMLSPGFRA